MFNAGDLSPAFFILLLRSRFVIFDMESLTPRQTSGPTHLLDAFRITSLRFPDQVALKANGGLGKQYTYREAYSLSARLATALHHSLPHDITTIGLLSENRPEWPIIYLGIVGAGRTVVPIDANLKPTELISIIRLSGIRVLFTSDRFESYLVSNLPELTVHSLESTSARSWLSLLIHPPAQIEVDPDRLAVLIYTSGTTGSPSAVTLTHRNLLGNLDGIRPALPFDSDDIFLSVLPLHHTLEATCGFLAPLTSGSGVVYARSLKSKEILEDIAHNKVTVMCGVPLLFEKMHHAIRRGIQASSLPRRLTFHLIYAALSLGWRLGFKWGRPLFRSLRQQAGLSSIRMLVSGGAAIPVETARFYNLIGLDFLQGYGMTECSPVVSVNRPDNIQFGSVGPPLPNLEVRIDQPDEHGIGEIVVKGPSITSGYRDNEAKTAELLRNGWLHTGDLGRIHHGHLWITGRLKNVIVSAAGKNIYPEELEEHLLESPYVSEAIVFGRLKIARQGEEVRALIVPDLDQFRTEFSFSSEAPDLERIKVILTQQVEQVNRRLADYKRISGFDFQLEELEKTSTRKLKRFIYTA